MTYLLNSINVVCDTICAVDAACAADCASRAFLDAAHCSSTVRVEPIPPELDASSQSELDQIAQHVRCGTEPTWPTLRVTLVDTTTMAPETIPHELRPVGDEGAVLLGGNSDASKSTSTMACAKGHPDVLGDDQVIIEIGEHGPVAHTVYRLAKLTSGSLDLLPHRRDHVLAEGRYRRALIARAEVLDTLLHQMRPT